MDHLVIRPTDSAIDVPDSDCPLRQNLPQGLELEDRLMCLQALPQLSSGRCVLPGQLPANGGAKWGVQWLAIWDQHGVPLCTGATSCAGQYFLRPLPQSEALIKIPFLSPSFADIRLVLWSEALPAYLCPYPFLPPQVLLSINVLHF